MKVCSYGPSHIRIMSIYVVRKILRKASFIFFHGQWPWALICNIVDVGPTIFVQMIILG